MERDRAVKKYRVPREIHLQFVEEFLRGEPKYEFLQEED